MIRIFPCRSVTLSTALSLALAISGWADTPVRWIAQSGEFQNPANWESGAVPGPKQTAVFAPDGNLTVRLAANASLAGLDQQGTGSVENPARLIFDLGGQELEVGNPEIQPGQAPISLQAHQHSGPRIIAIANGSLKSPAIALNNPVSPAWSQLVIGAGGKLEAPVVVGNNQQGAIKIEAGGQWTSQAAAIYIGRVGDGAKGKVSIAGNGSVWTALGQDGQSPGMVTVAGSGSGLLDISAGGRMQAHLIQLAAHQKHLETPFGMGRGGVHVRGPESRLECTWLYVGGGRNAIHDTEAAPGGGGTAWVSDGAKILLEQAHIFPHSTVSLDRGQLLQADSNPENGTGRIVFEAGSVLHYVLRTPLATAPLQAATIDLDGAILDLELAAEFTARPGDEFVLIEATTAVRGKFAGLADGGTLRSGGAEFAIDYGRVDAGPVTVTVQLLRQVDLP